MQKTHPRKITAFVSKKPQFFDDYTTKSYGEDAALTTGDSWKILCGRKAWAGKTGESSELFLSFLRACTIRTESEQGKRRQIPGGGTGDAVEAGTRLFLRPGGDFRVNFHGVLEEAAGGESRVLTARTD